MTRPKGIKAGGYGDESQQPSKMTMPFTPIQSHKAFMRYHAAFRHGITFNFQPHAPPEYLKHRLLTDQHSHLYPYDHHHTAHVSQHSITMPSPYSYKSFFEDPSDIEMEDLSLPKQPLCIKKSLQSIRSTFLCNHTPVKELPGIPQLALYDNPITPTIPIDPLFPP